MKQKTTIMQVLFIGLIFIFLINTSTATKPMLYNNMYITSADQYYSVFFDEEGEAFVALRIDIHNQDSKELEWMNVEIPGYNIQVLNVLQDSNIGYQKINVNPIYLSKSTIISLDLIEIMTNSDSSVLIIYKAQGYVEEILSKFDFQFETAKISMISDVRVSINVQDELILKGGKSKVNYLPSFVNYASTQGSMEMTKEIGRMSDSLRYEQGYVKSVFLLDPLESYTVKGSYSRSWLRLNLVKISIFTILGIIILFLILFKFKKTVRKIKETKKDRTSIIISKMYGFYMALGITIIWTIILYLGNIFSHTYGLPQFMIAIIMLLGALLSLAIIIGVPIFIGIKEGALAGFLSVMFTFGWLILFCVIIVFLLSFVKRRVVYF